MRGLQSAEFASPALQLLSVVVKVATEAVEDATVSTLTVVENENVPFAAKSNPDRGPETVT